MKTLFMLMDTGSAIRNVLRSELFETLRSQPDLRLVIFTPLDPVEMTEEFGGENVICERIPKWRANPLVKTVRSIKRDIWAQKSDIFSFRHRREKRKNRVLRKYLIPFLNKLFFKGDADAAQQLLYRLEMFFTPLLEPELFARYKPDMVFFTTLYSMDCSVEISAHKQGIPTLCLIHSWDNPTTKGPFPFRPDRVIVWNAILEQEVMTHQGIPREDIRISGVPQFDIYADRASFTPRDRFFQQHGLDLERKLITYTTASTGGAPFEADLVDRLHRDLVSDDFPYPVQLLVRLHPKDDMALYQHLQGRPHLILARPGRPSTHIVDSWNPTREEMYGLAELMLYTDVNINVASTITLDAAMFDTPVINVAYDGPEEKVYLNSCRRYYDYEHYLNIVNTGAVSVAYSHEELLKEIILDLEQPQRHAEGRQTIRKQQAHFTDGQSAKRIAGFVTEFLAETSP
ncbi:MAG: CDP-glycerol glycerophosphotransferase family protein [Magnetococcales bacterium]|nr:CDP-glycerol glycerophosphotransferase family protein [Magnetococcales bacterium]